LVSFAAFYYRRALEIRTSRLSKDHAQVQLTLQNLAQLRVKQEYWDEAEGLWKRVLQSALRRGREARKDQTSVVRERRLVELGIGQLFLTLMSQEKYEVAFELCAARLESAQVDTPDHACCLVRLAQAQQAKRDRHGAIDSYTAVLDYYNSEEFQKVAGISCSTLARIHYRLGRLYLNVGNKAAALEHASEAHRFWQHLVLTQTKPTAETANNPLQLGRIRSEQLAAPALARQCTRKVGHSSHLAPSARFDGHCKSGTFFVGERMIGCCRCLTARSMEKMRQWTGTPMPMPRSLTRLQTLGGTQFS
jgi:tetratricopeptide (TPR) repeat protein